MQPWEKKYYDVASANEAAGVRPVVGITANFGEYGSQLAEAYYESVRLAGGVPVIVPASESVADLDDVLLRVDALVFSGGGDINPLLLGVEPEPVETEEPVPEEAEPETGGNTGMLLAVLAVALVGGGAAFYFKVLRPKQQKAAEPQEDYGDELPDYDGPDGYGDEDDDGPPWDEEDDNGEEADK